MIMAHRFSLLKRATTLNAASGPIWKKPLVVACALAFAATANSASATTLTFNGVAGTTYTNFGSYTEAGYTFTLYGGWGVSQTHVGDGTYTANTLNWHDGGNNGTGAVMSMTRVGGGLFDLTGITVDARPTLTISAAGYSTQQFTGNNVTYNLSFLGVDRVDFSASTGYAVGIDNVVVNSASVPLPSTAALFGLGLIGMGAAVRRQSGHAS